MGVSLPDEEALRQARIVRELGKRTPGTYLAEAPQGKRVVLETVSDEVGALALRLVGFRHPHVVAVLSVERTGASWSVATEHVDGVPLEEVFFGLSLGGRLRAVVDVLAALSALHSHAGGLVHRGVLLRSTFIDKGGRTKLAFAYRAPLCFGRDGYAPEVLVRDTSAIDARTDVYGAGVMLWEAITGRVLFGNMPAETIIKQQLGGRIDKARPPRSDGWARSVLPVVERALAVDPKDRYQTVAEMAAALRIAVRARLMFHEDIVEEIWPAETVPRHSSGIQVVAEAPPASEPPPASETKIAVTPIVTPPAVVAPVLAPPHVSRMGWMVAVLVALTIASLVGVFALGRSHPAPSAPVVAEPHETTVIPMTTAEVVSATGVIPPAPLPRPAETVAPRKAPTVKARPAAKSPGTYDPSSI